MMHKIENSVALTALSKQVLSSNTNVQNAIILRSQHPVSPQMKYPCMFSLEEWHNCNDGNLGCGYLHLDNFCG